VTLIRMGRMRLIYIHRPATTYEHGRSLEWPSLYKWEKKKKENGYKILYVIDSINVKAQLLFLALIFFFSIYYVRQRWSDDVVSGRTAASTTINNDGSKEYIQTNMRFT
jgi:hypothetical protein